MLGTILVFSCLFAVCLLAIRYPPAGVIGFYGFLLLDPEWNWRWAMPHDVPLQKSIFVALLIGFGFAGFRIQYQSKSSKWVVSGVVAFFVLCWLSSTQSFSPENSSFFMSVFWKQMLMLTAAIFLLDSPKSLKYLLVVAVVAQGYNALQINLEYFQTGFSRYAHRPWGSTGADNNGYSIITLPIMAGSFALAFFEKRLIVRGVLFGIGMLQIHQIMLMESRGCMLAAVAMFGILVWYMPRKNGNAQLVFTAVLLAGLLAGPSVVKEFNSSFAQGEQQDSSAQSRFYLWKAGWQITMDHPLLGVGPNAARVLVPAYYEGGLEQEDKALHNLFFDVSTGAGVFGFVAYFTIFALPLLHAFRTYDAEDDELGALRLAVIAGIPGYLAASMFSSGLLFESCYVLVILGCVCSNIESYTDRLRADEGLELPTDESILGQSSLGKSDLVVS